MRWGVVLRAPAVQRLCRAAIAGVRDHPWMAPPPSEAPFQSAMTLPAQHPLFHAGEPRLTGRRSPWEGLSVHSDGCSETDASSALPQFPFCIMGTIAVLSAGGLGEPHLQDVGLWGESWMGSRVRLLRTLGCFAFGALLFLCSAHRPGQNQAAVGLLETVQNVQNPLVLFSYV